MTNEYVTLSDGVSSALAAEAFTYTYDASGNIIEIKKNGATLFRYAYDSLNQLVREDNRYTGKSYTWKYDEAGNILNRKTYAYTIDALGTVQNTVIYGYDNGSWGDLLISFNGQSIAYDGIGNPKTWNGSALTWQGRRLMSYGANTYTYNADGIRTSKTVNGVEHIYHLSGTQILDEEWIEGNIRHLMVYVYDASGQPIGMSHYENGEQRGTYVFVKNIQGDVIGIYDDEGTCLVTYTYDAWGNVTVSYSNGGASTAAKYNPFRYRGYYYDTETGFYYVSSRYYDPEIGRFINADGLIGANSDMATYNLFAYCGNNPVVRYDDTGMFWKELISGVIHVGNNFAVAIGIDTAAIGAFFLMMEKDGSGVYHARQDCWQQYGGYNDLYDFAFNLGTSMEAVKFSFSYNGSGYTIWAWKGDYVNLGAGAELGIYRGSSGHRTVDTSLAMWTGMIVSYNGECIIDYFPSEDQWWITGFNPKYQNVSASNLRVTIGVGFNSTGMYQAFKNTWGGDSRWSFYDYLNLAILQF